MKLSCTQIMAMLAFTAQLTMALPVSEPALTADAVEISSTEIHSGSALKTHVRADDHLQGDSSHGGENTQTTFSSTSPTTSSMTSLTPPHMTSAVDLRNSTSHHSTTLPIKPTQTIPFVQNEGFYRCWVKGPGGKLVEQICEQPAVPCPPGVGKQICAGGHLPTSISKTAKATLSTSRHATTVKIHTTISKLGAPFATKTHSIPTLATTKPSPTPSAAESSWWDRLWGLDVKTEGDSHDSYDSYGSGRYMDGFSSAGFYGLGLTGGRRED